MKQVSNNASLIKQLKEFMEHFLDSEAKYDEALLSVSKKSSPGAKEASGHFHALVKYLNDLQK